MGVPFCLKNCVEESEWVDLDSKSVLDYDGFYTDYTLWTNGLQFVCIFGDNDLYNPENSDPDFETNDEDEAYEWFNSYEGFVDEPLEDDEIDY